MTREQMIDLAVRRFAWSDYRWKLIHKIAAGTERLTNFRRVQIANHFRDVRREQVC